MHYTPTLLLKVRSEALLKEIGRLHHCTARVSSFRPGHTCSDRSTTVAAHFNSLGKGWATKSSDVFACCACYNCHNVLDGVDQQTVKYIKEHCEAAYWQRAMKAWQETIAILIMREKITINFNDVELI